MDAFPGHFLESTKVIDIKLGLQIDSSEGKGSAPKRYSYLVYRQELSPHNHFFIIDACPGHILESTKGIGIKLGTYIDVNKRKCRRQEP